MTIKRDLRAALAAIAAAAGTGIASGRALVLFFAQLGQASWLGIAFASLLYGLLLSGVCRAAARVGAGNASLLLARALRPGWAGVARTMHGLLMSLIAAAMLASTGELGALTLPMSHSRAWGMLLGLGAALGLCLWDGRGMAAAGGLTLLLGAGLYGALALDPRPVRVYLRSETSLALENSIGATLLLAAMYASLNAAVSAGAALAGEERRNAGRMGALCGGLMAALLICANAALWRGGRELLSQAMPMVILAARWGSAGFWLCAGFGFLCATGTLAASMGALGERMRGGRGERAAGVLYLLLAALLAVMPGMDDALARAFPAVGWLCALGVAALSGRLERAG